MFIAGVDNDRRLMVQDVPVDSNLEPNIDFMEPLDDIIFVNQENDSQIHGEASVNARNRIQDIIEETS